MYIIVLTESRESRIYSLYKATLVTFVLAVCTYLLTKFPALFLGLLLFYSMLIMKLSISFLLGSLLGAVVMPGLMISIVRGEMQRQLSSEEKASYWGIMQFGVNATVFEELYGVETAEELILAEFRGAYFKPKSEDRNTTYFFLVGKGLTASLNPGFAAFQEAKTGHILVYNQTVIELDAMYRAMALPEDSNATEEYLNNIISLILGMSSRS